LYAFHQRKFPKVTSELQVSFVNEALGPPFFNFLFFISCILNGFYHLSPTPSSQVDLQRGQRKRESVSKPVPTAVLKLVLTSIIKYIQGCKKYLED
jgi:hypothetical protein